MTIRPRAVRALRDVRVRLRDAAAASHATAATARDAKHAELDRERGRLEEFLDDAIGVLSAARNVHELDRVAETTGVHRLEIADASARHVEAIAATEAAAGYLRDRARELKRAELLVERVTDERARTEAKTEQRVNDDMSTRRR